MESESVQYTFFGRVHPENRPIAISKTGREVEGQFFDYRLEWSIDNNHVVANVFLDEEIDDVFTLRNQIKFQIQGTIDFISYVIGLPYKFEVEYVRQPDGTTLSIRNQINSILELTEDIDRDEILGELLTCLLTPGGNYLRLAIIDFRNAMEEPTETGFHCYRGLESIKQYMISEFSLKDEENEDQWDKMWDELDYDNSFVMDSIKPKADDRRHGNLSEISSSDRDEIFVETWEIILEFSNYLIDKYEPERVEMPSWKVTWS